MVHGMDCLPEEDNKSEEVLLKAGRDGTTSMGG
jgi:hypothetical protein